MDRPRILSRTALGALAVLALAACSGGDYPTQIASGPQAAADGTLAPQMPPPVKEAFEKEVEPAGASADIIQLPYSTRPSSTTRFIEAAHGGEVACGRYRVKIAPGALETDTAITVRDPGSGYLVCDLEPHGLTFLTPIRLEMNVSGLSIATTDGLTIFWLDQAAECWIDLGGAYNAADGVLSAELKHFSRYAGGRAGW